jgi:transcriptional regulator with XRE-family HTH domain
MDAAILLQEARRAAGLTQRELARRAGVAQPAISRIERGRLSPRVGTLDRLLRVCGKGIELVARPGTDLDHTLIRERLGLSAAERVRLTVAGWEGTRPFRGADAG